MPRVSIFALLGSHGAGKTTVDGIDVVTEPVRVRESLGLTGQLAAVDEILTGREKLRRARTSVADVMFLSGPRPSVVS